MRLIIEREKLEKAKEVFNTQPIMVKVQDKEGNLLEIWEIDAILSKVTELEGEIVENQVNESESMTESQETNDDEITGNENNERTGKRKRSNEGLEINNNEEKSQRRKTSKSEIRDNEGREDDEKWLKEKKRLDKFLKEIKTPNDEIGEEIMLDETSTEIKDIVRLYLEAEKGNSKSIKKWYRLGEMMEVKAKQKMMQDRRLKNKEKVKRDIIKEIKDQIVEIKQTDRDVIDSNLRRGLKTYYLFEEIGVEKIARIKKSVTAVTDITERGIEYVKRYLLECRD